MHKIKNKKSQLGEITQDFMAFIGAFFLVVIFFIASIALANSSNNNIKQEGLLIADSVRTNVALNNLLKEKFQINIDGQTEEITFADLIRLSQINNSYESDVKKIINDLEKFCYNTSKQQKNIFGCHFAIKEDEFCAGSENLGGSKVVLGNMYDLACIPLPSDKTIYVSVSQTHGQK